MPELQSTRRLLVCIFVVAIVRPADKLHQSLQMLAKLLDRTHLLEGKKLPYPVTGKGYQCVQQVSQRFAPESVCAGL